MLKTNYENVTFIGDTILELQKDFISGTITCSFLNNTIKKTVMVKELGERYISLDIDPEAIPFNSVLNISYKVKDEYSKLSESQKIASLEKRLDDQEKVMKELLAGMKNRVDIQTFTVWIKALENKLGVDLIDQHFSQGK